MFPETKRPRAACRGRPRPLFANAPTVELGTSLFKRILDEAHAIERFVQVLLNMGAEPLSSSE